MTSLRHRGPGTTDRESTRWLKHCARFALVVLAVHGPRLPLSLPAQDVGLAIGSTPPAAVVEDLDGQAVDLSTLTGRKPVVFEFWASWCEVCAALMPTMLAAQRHFGSRVDFVLVGVGVNQTRNSMRRHREAHPLPFRYVFDNAGAAVRAFQAPATSYVAIVDAHGKVVYTGSGEDQNIEAAITRALGSSGTR